MRKCVKHQLCESNKYLMESMKTYESLEKLNLHETFQVFHLIRAVLSKKHTQKRHMLIMSLNSSHLLSGIKLWGEKF